MVQILMVLMAGSFAACQTQSSPSPAPGPDPYVQFLENWIPGIGECTELHDKLHDHFGLDFSVNSEARLLGFQLGHHPAGNFLHVIIFAVISTLMYPPPYRNGWSDLRDFFRSYVLGKNFQLTSYWFIPRGILAWPRA